MIQARNKARFAMEGFRVRRANPDGTMVKPDRLIGFANTVDVSDYEDDAELEIKIGARPWQKQTLDVGNNTLVADLTSMSVAEAIALLDDAGFSGVTFSVDSLTQRLKVAATSVGGTTPLDLQIRGGIAGAMDFGQGIQYKGRGSYYLSFINDEAISATLPNEIRDRENIDMEGAKGSVTRMIIPAKRLGVNPVITMKFKNDELTQMIQGGNYDPGDEVTPATYDPPTSDDAGSPILTIDVFAPLYGDGASQMDQVIGMDRRLFYAATGIEADVPMEAKSWAQFAYNCTVTEYTDENGKKFPAEKRFEYDLTQWEALDVYGVTA